jgi:hypothetical protein
VGRFDGNYYCLINVSHLLLQITVAFPRNQSSYGEAHCFLCRRAAAYTEVMTRNNLFLAQVLVLAAQDEIYS